MYNGERELSQTAAPPQCHLHPFRMKCRSVAKMSEDISSIYLSYRAGGHLANSKYGGCGGAELKNADRPRDRAPPGPEPISTRAAKIHNSFTQRRSIVIADTRFAHVARGRKSITHKCDMVRKHNLKSNR